MTRPVRSIYTQPHSATPLACSSLHKTQNETQREREIEREGTLTTMERVVQVLVKAVVNKTKKVVSGSKSVFSMAEEVAKRLVVIGPELLLFGVLKCFLGGSGRIASVAIFILEIIINSRPWKKD